MTGPRPMTDIPADILLAADKAIYAACFGESTAYEPMDGWLNSDVTFTWSDAVEQIAHVLMAERERCAKIADGFTIAAHIAHDMKSGIFPKCSSANVAIASAIRSERAGE